MPALGHVRHGWQRYRTSGGAPVLRLTGMLKRQLDELERSELALARAAAAERNQRAESWFYESADDNRQVHGPFSREQMQMP